MQYVLDTNVVSALRVRGRNPQVEAWAASVPGSDQFVTAMTIAELERAVIWQRAIRPTSRRGPAPVVRRTASCRPLRTTAAHRLPAAQILATYRVPEHAPLDDALIAGVVDAAQLTVFTRNTRHFEPLGVVCLNPWGQNP